MYAGTDISSVERNAYFDITSKNKPPVTSLLKQKRNTGKGKHLQAEDSYRIPKPSLSFFHAFPSKRKERRRKEKCLKENSTYSKNVVVMRPLVSQNMHKKS